MEQVRVYKTKDGTLFDDRVAAEQHELMLNIRGIIQTKDRSASFTPTQMAKFIADNQDTLFEKFKKYRNTMTSIKGAETKRIKIG